MTHPSRMLAPRQRQAGTPTAQRRMPVGPRVGLCAPEWDAEKEGPRLGAAFLDLPVEFPVADQDTDEDPGHVNFLDKKPSWESGRRREGQMGGRCLPIHLGHSPREAEEMPVQRPLPLWGLG